MNKINNIYNNISGFNVSNYDKTSVKALGSNPTYGELTPETIELIMKDYKTIKNT